jgi:tetratricopeptide (TPR) repeat protein
MCYVRPLLGGALAAGLIAGAAWFVADHSPLTTPHSPLPTSIPVRPESEAAYDPYRFNLTTDQSIEFFRRRTDADPQDYLSLAHLAGAYIRKARADGDHSAYESAEAALRRVVKIAPHHRAARVGLAVVACARHRFAEGLRLAEELYRDSPDDLESLAVIGDARLELGEYDGAEQAYRELERRAPKPTAPAILARLARMTELRGDPDEAVRLLKLAADKQQQAHDFKTAGAWYAMRLGEVHFSQGRLDEAVRQLESALQDHPNYPAALGLLAKVRAAQGRVDDAEELYRRAIGINPNLSLLIELGDLYARTGREFLARINYEMVEKTARDSTDFDRELALFYCNHDRQLPRSLELARRDLTVRKDIYAYDALAWALLKNDRPEEAQAAMTEALKLGTRDAALYYHAGMIAHRLGQTERARAQLRRALEVNPYFSFLHSEDVRRRLAE